MDEVTGVYFSNIFNSADSKIAQPEVLIPLHLAIQLLGLFICGLKNLYETSRFDSYALIEQAETIVEFGSIV